MYRPIKPKKSTVNLIEGPQGQQDHIELDDTEKYPGDSSLSQENETDFSELLDYGRTMHGQTDAWMQIQEQLEELRHELQAIAIHMLDTDPNDAATLAELKRQYAEVSKQMGDGKALLTEHHQYVQSGDYEADQQLLAEWARLFGKQAGGFGYDLDELTTADVEDGQKPVTSGTVILQGDKLKMLPQAVSVRKWVDEMGYSGAASENIPSAHVYDVTAGEATNQPQVYGVNPSIYQRVSVLAPETPVIIIQGDSDIEPYTQQILDWFGHGAQEVFTNWGDQSRTASFLLWAQSLDLTPAFKNLETGELILSPGGHWVSIDKLPKYVMDYWDQRRDGGPELPPPWKAGFVTSKGVFYDREQVVEYAKLMKPDVEDPLAWPAYRPGTTEWLGLPLKDHKAQLEGYIETGDIVQSKVNDPDGLVSVGDELEVIQTDGESVMVRGDHGIAVVDMDDVVRLGAREVREFGHDQYWRDETQMWNESYPATNSDIDEDPTLHMGDVEQPYTNDMDPANFPHEEDDVLQHNMRMHADKSIGFDPYLPGQVYEYAMLTPQHQAECDINFKDHAAYTVWQREDLPLDEVLSVSPYYYSAQKKRWKESDYTKAKYLAQRVIEGHTITPIMISDTPEDRSGVWEGMHRLAAAELSGLRYVPCMVCLGQQEQPEPGKKQPWICVDLDGTLLEPFTGPNEFGAPKPGAAEVMQQMLDQGWRVSIYTARAYFGDENQDWIPELEKYLDKCGIPYSDVYVGVKPPADAFIDDKAIHFDGSWDDVEQQIKKMPTEKDAIALIDTQEGEGGNDPAFDQNNDIVEMRHDLSIPRPHDTEKMVYRGQSMFGGFGSTQYMKDDGYLVDPNPADLMEAQNKLIMTKENLAKLIPVFEQLNNKQLANALASAMGKLSLIDRQLQQNEIKRAYDGLTATTSYLAAAINNTKSVGRSDTMDNLLRYIVASMADASFTLSKYYTPMMLARQLEKLKAVPKPMGPGKPHKYFDNSPAGYVDPELQKDLFGHKVKTGQADPLGKLKEIIAQFPELVSQVALAAASKGDPRKRHHYEMCLTQLQHSLDQAKQQLRSIVPKVNTETKIGQVDPQTITYEVTSLPITYGGITRDTFRMIIRDAQDEILEVFEAENINVIKKMLKKKYPMAVPTRSIFTSNKSGQFDDPEFALSISKIETIEDADETTEDGRLPVWHLIRGGNAESAILEAQTLMFQDPTITKIEVLQRRPLPTVDILSDTPVGKGEPGWNTVKTIIRPGSRVQAFVLTAYIKHVKGKGYCVYSHQTNKLFGCYPTKAEAEARLQQMHKFRSKAGKKHKDESKAKAALIFHGLPIHIEYHPGDSKTGTDPSTGEEYERVYQYPYGFIPLTAGNDGECIDCYLGPEYDVDEVYAIQQLTPDGDEDEEKFMVGFPSEEEAEQVYRDQMPEWAFGSIEPMKIDAFKEYILDKHAPVVARCV